jgi:hypothetical protein
MKGGFSFGGEKRKAEDSVGIEAKRPKRDLRFLPMLTDFEQEPKYSDMSVLTKDGIVMYFHKVYLIKSPVFEKMLTDTQESNCMIPINYDSSIVNLFFNKLAGTNHIDLRIMEDNFLDVFFIFDVHGCGNLVEDHIIDLCVNRFSISTKVFEFLKFPMENVTALKFGMPIANKVEKMFERYKKETTVINYREMYEFFTVNQYPWCTDLATNYRKYILNQCTNKFDVSEEIFNFVILHGFDDTDSSGEPLQHWEIQKMFRKYVKTIDDPDKLCECVKVIQNITHKALKTGLFDIVMHALQHI